MHQKIYNRLAELTFNKSDMLAELEKHSNPLEAFISLKKFSLTWIVQQIFRNESGLPLELLPFQTCLLDVLWNHKYPIVLASRGAGKTFMYAVYALLRAMLVPGSKICIVGAGFRQAKLVFNYIAKLYMSSPIVIEAIQHGGGPKYAVDQCSIQVGSSVIFAVPLGDGERIRGLRANVILCDEFASIADEIYEIVIQPFAAVRKDPAKQTKIVGAINKLKAVNAPPELIKLVEAQLGFGNQICISGTATYEFNHFYRKYEMYRKIIFSGGQKELIAQAFAEGNKMLTQTGGIDPALVKAFKHTDYAIFQLPYTGIPEGFMDDSVIANAKLTYDASKFGMEYLCKFAKDSDGFFKRSLIADATPIGDEEVSLELFGDPRCQYVMGIDPARYNDNCAICILKLTKRGYELVYSWAIRGKSFDVVVKQIRLLMARFNIVRIAMDQGGGGSTVSDMLYIKEFLKEGEEPLFRIDDEDNKFTSGKRIVDCFQWDNTWVRENNYAMKTEIMNRQLLFPDKANDKNCIDQYCRAKKVKSISDSEKSLIMEEVYGIFDKNDDKTIEGCWDNVQETINEMCAIVVKVTEGGQETWILPSLSAQQKNQSLTDARRRDRYSALLLAAYAARQIRGTGHEKKLLPLGGSDSYFKGQGRSSGGRINSNGSTKWPTFSRKSK